MSWTVLPIQALDGLQCGLLLFLLAAGLTPVLGVKKALVLAFEAQGWCPARR